MNNILILILINLYFIIIIKNLRKKFVSFDFKLHFWKYFYLNLVINLINFIIMNLTTETYFICFFFLHQICSIFFRKLLIIIYYNLYYKFDFFNKRTFMFYDFSILEKIKGNLVIFFFIIMYLYYNPIIYIFYLTLISIFNFNLTNKQYDEAILNKYDDCKIRLFLRGKKKLYKYKKFILDPETNKKYKFHIGYLIEHDKNHLHLICGKDFKFCRFQDNKMYLNNSL